MNFVLFLIVNAVLFLRPGELILELSTIPLYQIAILACLAVSIVPVGRFFFESPLRLHPTVGMVFAMFFIAIFTLFANRPGDAADQIFEYAKVIIYFVLFLALVTTPARLRALTAVVTLCVMVTATLGVLHFNEVISLPALQMKGEEVRVGDHFMQLRRLQFTGMLQDPNEVAVFLSTLSFLCAYQWQNRSFGAIRHLWLVPLFVFFAAIGFTVSRGGLLALMMGVVAFAAYRFQKKHRVQVAPGVFTEVYAKGSMRSVLAVVIVLPLILLAFGGRQTTISASEESAGGRIGLWSEWLEIFRSQPLWGVSPFLNTGTDSDMALRAGLGVSHVAHNSYLQAFADLGFVGGMCFLGAFLAAFVTLHRYAFGRSNVVDPEQKRLHPYLCGALAAYMMGMMTLTLNYLTATAFVLALPLSYYGMTLAYPVVQPPEAGSRGASRLALASVGYLAAMYVFVRVFRPF
jgi:O-antigen ligase